MLPAAKDLSVVDVTCELPRTHETGGGYLCLPTWGEGRGIWKCRAQVNSVGNYQTSCSCARLFPKASAGPRRAIPGR